MISRQLVIDHVRLWPLIEASLKQQIRLIQIPYMWVVYLVVILIWQFGEFLLVCQIKPCRFNCHTRNELIYLPFRQIKMTPTLFVNKSPNIRLASKSTYVVFYPSGYSPTISVINKLVSTWQNHKHALVQWTTWCHCHHHADQKLLFTIA